MVRAKVVTVMRWYAQDEVNQEDSEQNEVDGMKKGADSADVFVISCDWEVFCVCAGSDRGAGKVPCSQRWSDWGWRRVVWCYTESEPVPAKRQPYDSSADAPPVTHTNSLAQPNTEAWFTFSHECKSKYEYEYGFLCLHGRQRLHTIL